MHTKIPALLGIVGLICLLRGSVLAQYPYPPETKLKFTALPAGIPKPAYLVPYNDPTFGSLVTRVADKVKFGTVTTWHQYSKNQPWNSDGTLILLDGWPGAILNGKTYKKLRVISPSADHHIWSNTNPNLIYGCTSNRMEAQNAINGTITTLHTFTPYSKVSLGDWEGNVSNDDGYAALRCTKAPNNFIVAYDIKNDSVLATMSIGAEMPNNVTMSQSGKYVVVEWSSGGSGAMQGISAYNRDDLSFVRHLSNCGGCHYDLGYDTNGNEVIIVQSGSVAKAVEAKRLDNGVATIVLNGNLMSYPIHMTCRNLNRPGWAYFTEFETDYTDPSAPNYQQIFCVKIDGSQTVNCFAHVHHNSSKIEN